jgi:hypothetical protein
VLPQPEYAVARHFVIEKNWTRDLPWDDIDVQQPATRPPAMQAAIFRPDCHFVCVQKHLRAPPNKVRREEELQK